MGTSATSVMYNGRLISSKRFGLKPKRGKDRKLFKCLSTIHKLIWIITLFSSLGFYVGHHYPNIGQSILGLHCVDIRDDSPNQLEAGALMGRIADMMHVASIIMDLNAVVSANGPDAFLNASGSIFHFEKRLAQGASAGSGPGSGPGQGDMGINTEGGSKDKQHLSCTKGTCGNHPGQKEATYKWVAVVNSTRGHNIYNIPLTECNFSSKHCVRTVNLLSMGIPVSQVLNNVSHIRFTRSASTKYWLSAVEGVYASELNTLSADMIEYMSMNRSLSLNLETDEHMSANIIHNWATVIKIASDNANHTKALLRRIHHRRLQNMATQTSHRHLFVVELKLWEATSIIEVACEVLKPLCLLAEMGELNHLSLYM